MSPTPMPEPAVPWLTPQRRAWLYRVVVAVAPVLTAYGIADESQVALWVGLVATILGTGTAALHTPT